MTFAVLRALHAILGDALTDIEAVYAAADPPPTHKKANSFSRVYASPPPSPSSYSTSAPPNSNSTLDFPSLDAPYDPASAAEQLTAHPTVVAAINRIVAAAGQMAATVQVPFLTLCDAGMGYHLPSCLRVLEAAHVVEVLRDRPVHVREIAARTGVEQAKLGGALFLLTAFSFVDTLLGAAHILRLLATHHILREAAPDVFAANRISSLIDSGKPLCELVANPETKYASVGDADASAVAAFVGLCTDELFKSSAYLTEAVFPGNARLYPASSAASSSLLPSPSMSPPFSSSSSAMALGVSSSVNKSTSAATASSSASTAASTPATATGSDPTRAPFNYAFGCGGVGYFAWLEGEGWGAAPGEVRAGVVGEGMGRNGGKGRTGKGGEEDREGGGNPNRFRLERFGKAMAGTGSWEAPGAVLHGFDWASLPRGSVVVDVGGGIGSTSMLLASAYAEVDADGSGGLRFVIQDRPVVVEMGEKAWRAKCPELLDSGAVRFQVHDFFTPQPVTDAAVFLLRVVLHDWPDAFAHRILLRLREAAAPHTKLVLADFVLPLACVDDFGVGEGGIDVQVEGAEKMLAPAPLLANLGKASANAYWMDLTMQVTFNGQERTLREIVALALTAGWKVVRVTKAPGSLFGHIVAVPVAVPVSPQRRARAGSGSAFFDVPRAGGTAGAGNAEVGEMEMVERASSRCGTPTFGSRVDLPSVAEARARFGGGVVGTRRSFGGSRAPPPPPPLKQPVVLTGPPGRKKKPSLLSVAPPPSSPSPNLPSYRPATSPRPPPVQQHQQQYASPITRRIPPAPLRTQSQQLQPPAPSPVPRQPPPPSPMSPRLSLSRRSSYAHLSQTVQLQSQNQTQSQAPTPTSQGNTLRHVPSSPVLKQSYRQHPQPSPSSPVPSRIPALTRRASHAQLQLPQTELRKRSGSIVTPSMVRAAAGGESGLGGGHTYGHELGSLLLHGRASGGALDFGAKRRQRGDGGSEGGDIDDELSSRCASPVLLPARSVLAAAARIERGIPRAPSPDP
ncbi:O-methyltransferase [Mycena albidolilacea]|uniref:O-methyltransferase n=1 Tax=Mycena albidolilacea TaxID=1033008 RepID=A0AAD7A2F2_9AGAR|nr:O-methyltransferase [Mycena albidolilacea]